MTKLQTDDGAVLPCHIGIIMDGNGRWANSRKLPRTMGHKEGLETAKRIIAAAATAGIRYVTLYTFSTENWKRSLDEVSFLMGLVKVHLRNEFEFYKTNHIRILHAGDESGLPSDIQDELRAARSDTAHFDGLSVVLALNYGGRDEIIRAVHKIPGYLNSELTEKSFQTYLDVPELPDMDMLIRTGGEKRLSNFMLWQSAYTELFFSDTLWPDYSVNEFMESIQFFQKRQRRFGGV